MCALSNKPTRGGATRLRPEMVFVGEKVWGFLRWMGSFDTPVTEQRVCGRGKVVRLRAMNSINAYSSGTLYLLFSIFQAQLTVGSFYSTFAPSVNM